MKQMVAILLFVMAGALPSAALAETVLRTGSDISVNADQIIDGNYYVSVWFGDTSMSGTVERDMIAIGNSVTVNGEVKEDLHILGGVAHVHGPVGGDVRVIGADVIIGDTVGGDVVVIGGTLSILSTATIGGDVFFFGATGELSGVVTGSVYGSTEQFTINGEVQKAVDIAAPAGLRLTDRAVVAGDVRYSSLVPLQRNPGAAIGGSVVENSTPQTERDVTKTALTGYLVILFTTLSLYLIFRREVELVAARTEGSRALSGLIGLGVVIVLPMLSVILILTVLGSIFGVMSLLVTTLLIIAGVALTPITLGALIGRHLFSEKKLSQLSIIVGVFSLFLLVLIPVIGPVLVFLLVLVTIGELTKALYRSLS
jgi:hypothetical protein